jgi:hypothetical protein
MPLPWSDCALPCTPTFAWFMRSSMCRYEQRIRQLFVDAIDAGSIRGDLDVDHAVLVFFSVGNWAYAWMTPKTDVDEQAEAFWVLLFGGFAPA